MKKRLLIVCSVLVLVVALAVPAFAVEPEIPDNLTNTSWYLRDDLSALNKMVRGTYNINFTVGSQEYTSMYFGVDANGDKYVYCIGFDGVYGEKVIVCHYSYSSASGQVFDYVSANLLQDNPNLLITGGDDVENADLIKNLQLIFTHVPPPPPIYNSVPDAVTGGLPGILEIFGSILTALFTPTGDLFQLGIVIAVCFGGAVIYGGVRLFRKLTPGV